MNNNSSLKNITSTYPQTRQERTEWILKKRTPKNFAFTDRPLGFFTEKEPFENGAVEDVFSIILVNRECPWRCLMCDLWKNTTNYPLKPGSIIKQINFAFEQSGIIRTNQNRETVNSASNGKPFFGLKLYNAGSFFDAGAIPPQDYPDIARYSLNFQRLIVESHPALIGERTHRFLNTLREIAETSRKPASAPDLEVAIGLETARPDILQLLNKGMKLEDFASACEFLIKLNVNIRAFILLNPPFLTDESECVKWALQSVRFAYDCGVSKAVLIPVRRGNGAIDELYIQKNFIAANLSMIEYTFENALALKRGIAMVDLWDIDLLKANECPACFEQRVERLRKMNLEQKVLPEVFCDVCNNRTADIVNYL